MPNTSSSSTGSAPQPMAAPPNPSRPQRKMSSAALRLPSYTGRTAGSPMSFGAAMSGISFGNGGGGGGGGFSYNRAPGSYGARFYGDAGDSPGLFDPAQMNFGGQSVNMDGGGSFVSSSAAFGLMSSSYTRRSYAAAAGGREVWSPANLSASLASLTTNPMGSMSHSYSRGQLETLLSKRNEAEYTKEYDCCGYKLQGLHALLEHVEDQHPYSDPTMPDAGFSPVTLAMDLEIEGDMDHPPSITTSARSSTSPRPMANYPLTPTSTSAPKTDGAAPPTSTNNIPNNNNVTQLSLSDVLKSPPQDESGLPAFNRQSGSPDSTGTATSSAHPAAPKITSASRGAFLAGGAKGGQQRFDRAFNEVVATGRSPKDSHSLLEDSTQPAIPTAVAPSVLFTSSAAMGIPGASQVVGRREGATGATNGSAAPPPPAAGAAGAPPPPSADAKPPAAGDKPADNAGAPPPPPGAAAAAAGDRPKAPEPQLPQPSLFTTHKAWRCPNPGCNKAYKQSNGLKYHLQKGQCDFAIHDALDHGLTLEEAEERARPYVCAVGAGCTKRYRQMNGLKYHYLNSGEHGQYGLRMLQNGTHPHPPSLPPPPKRDRPPQTNRERQTPYAIPSHMQRPASTPAGHQVQGAPVPRMGTWPARPMNGAAPVPAAVNGAAAPSQLQRPATTGPGIVPPAAAVAAASAAASKPAPTPPAAAPKPVQRGRDAVLFSSIDLTDV